MKRIIALVLPVALCMGCAESTVAPAPEAIESDFLLEAENHPVAAKNAMVSVTSVEIFQPAGPAGDEGVLTEGETFGPTKGSHARLLRGEDFIQVNIHTTGLPPGAYTVWWVLINETGACVPTTDPMNLPDIVGDCGFDEVFDIGGPSAPSAFWATGGIVQSNGVGNFNDRTSIGDDPGAPGSQHLWGPGLTNPGGTLVISIIKYHGLPSDDPDELWAQTHTFLGLCNEAANAYPDGQCFDPQWAIIAP